MRPWCVLILDAFRESLHQRSLHLLLFIAAALAFFTFGLSLTPEAPESVLHRHSEEFNVFRMGGTFGTGFTTKTRLDLEVLESRTIGDQDELPEDYLGGCTALLRFENRNHYDGAYSNWKSFATAKRTGRWPKPEEREAFTGYQDADRIAFAQDRLLDFGYRDTRVEVVESESALSSSSPLVLRFTVPPQDSSTIEGAYRLGLFFNRLEVPLPLSLQSFVSQVERTLGQVMVGFLGVLILVSTAASFIPNLMQKGTIDLVLARPIGRAQLLLMKYVGGVIFSFLVLVILVAPSWFAFALETGIWSLPILVSTLTATTIFAILYAVGVLTGVMTRSATASSMLTLGVWGASTAVSKLYPLREELAPEIPIVPRALEAAYAVFPNIPELAKLNETLFANPSLETGMALDLLATAEPEPIRWVYLVVTTVLFSAACLLAALWLFSRRDCS